MTLNQQRLKSLMYGLLYPAVLGAFFYDLLLAGARSAWFSQVLSSDRKFIVGALIAVHFIIDYALTQEIGGYRLSIFVTELGIIALMFIAFRAVNLHGDAQFPIDVRVSAFALTGVYILFLFWEYLMREELGFHLTLAIYESTAVLLFFIVALLNLGTNALLLVLIINTALMVTVCGPIANKYGRRPS